VLKRDFEFSDNEVSKIMENVLMFVTIVETNSKVEVVKDDPEISYDKHLLKLKEYQGIKIVKPEEFLGILS
jgi:predicted nucleic acid-binding protein